MYRNIVSQIGRNNCTIADTYRQTQIVVAQCTATYVAYAYQTIKLGVANCIDIEYIGYQHIVPIA